MNVQGDEPFIKKDILNEIIDVFKKDKKKGKSTIINLMGYKNALGYASKLKKKILLKLKKHGKNSGYLIDTIEFIKKRNF